MRQWLRCFMITVMILMSAGFAYAEPETSGDKSASAPTETAALKTAWSIEINLPAFRLTLVRDGKPYHSYPVAIGKPTKQTPTGTFHVLNRVKNPTWYPSDGRKAVPPGPSNPLGSWWFGVTRNGVGIHGNGKDDTVRTAVSLGCIRMYNQHVTELAAYVTVGMPVTITYQLVEPLLIAEGWQMQIFKNVYQKPFPSAEEIAASFAATDFGGRTDWYLARALALAGVGGGSSWGSVGGGNKLWLPVKSVLEMGPVSFDIYYTPDEIWIPSESAWAILWLAGIGNIRPLQGLAIDWSKQAIKAGDKSYIPAQALIESADGRFRIEQGEEHSGEEHSGYTIVFETALAFTLTDVESQAQTQTAAAGSEQ